MAKEKSLAKSPVSKPRVSKSKAAPAATNSLEAEIRARAYELWEEAGKPDGAEEHHWHAARQEIERGQAGK